MSVRGPTVEFTAKAIKSTDAAVLCEIDGEEMWIPQSQIHDDSEVWKEGDEGKLVVSQWIAKKKDLI
jgi:hypothetical protein